MYIINFIKLFAFNVSVGIWTEKSLSHFQIYLVDPLANTITSVVGSHAFTTRNSVVIDNLIYVFGGNGDNDKVMR